MKHYLTLTLCAATAIAAVPAFALDVQLPPETAKFKPSDLPGYALAQRNCMTCHSVHYVQTQPPTSSRTYWDATVRKMKKPFGAQFPDADIAPMVDYLTKVYGAEQATATAGNPNPSATQPASGPAAGRP